MPRASSFVRWMVLALIVGLLALHLPLDALRLHPQAQAQQAAATSCASGCCAPVASAPDLDDGCPEPTLDAPDAPAPQDGCDPGCHCGCCGGVPLVADVRPTVVLEATSAPSIAFDRSTARRARRLEIFHPPRA